MVASARPKVSNSPASAARPAALSRATSSTSPPAEKFPPAPRITITADSAPSRRRPASRLRASVTVTAFMASGRLSVSQPTGPSRAVRTVAASAMTGHLDRRKSRFLWAVDPGSVHEVEDGVGDLTAAPGAVGAVPVDQGVAHSEHEPDVEAGVEVAGELSGRLGLGGQGHQALLVAPALVECPPLDLGVAPDPQEEGNLGQITKFRLDGAADDVLQPLSGRLV